MKDWFLQLPGREQWIVLLGSTVLLVFLLDVLVWSPVANSNRQLRDSVQKAAEIQRWMRSAAAEIRQLKTAGQAGANMAAGAGQSLSNIVNTTVKSRKLPMSRFQPNGETEAQVWLDAVAFNDLIDWVYELEVQQGVSIDSLAVNQGSQSGTVSARVQLSRGQI